MAPPAWSENQKGVLSDWGLGLGLVILESGLGDTIVVVGIKKSTRTYRRGSAPSSTAKQPFLLRKIGSAAHPWGTWLRTHHWGIEREEEKKPSTRQESNPQLKEFCSGGECSTTLGLLRLTCNLSRRQTLQATVQEGLIVSQGGWVSLAPWLLWALMVFMRR